tara:strand:- start:83 stop:754 length:672 start_codon:yes stop_codon:yes gene_type:complete
MECSRFIEDSMIPCRLEKYLVDYTTLTRSEIVKVWMEGRVRYLAEGEDLMDRDGDAWYNSELIHEEASGQVQGDSGNDTPQQTVNSSAAWESDAVQHPRGTDTMQLIPRVKRPSKHGKFMSDFLVFGNDHVSVDRRRIVPSSMPRLMQYAGLEEGDDLPPDYDDIAPSSDLTNSRKNCFETICLSILKPRGVRVDGQTVKEMKKAQMMVVGKSLAIVCFDTID